ADCSRHKKMAAALICNSHSYESYLLVGENLLAIKHDLVQC
ncbi:MAG: hypothetical protein RIR02_168, partial [Pseudomonadota bacterium]